MLKARLHNGTATWTPAREEPEFAAIVDAELFAHTPESWRRLAPLLPLSIPEPHEAEDAAVEEGEEPMEFEMCPPSWNEWLSEDDREPDEQPSREDLVIGRTMHGDWFAVRTGDGLLPGDARVVHRDHETTCIADEWPTVAAFAAEIINACDRASGGPPA